MTGPESSDLLANARRRYIRPPVLSPVEPVNGAERTLILAALVMLMLLNIGLIGYRIGGVPVRAGLAVAMLAVLTLQYPGALGDAVRRHRMLIALAALLALVGTFVSIINNASFAVIATAIMEVHLQIMVTLLLATTVASLCGARAALLAIAGAIALSALVAMFQFLDFGWAWNLRDTLGQIQGQNMSEVKFFLKGRPMGFSFSPIHLATQLCLAFAAVAMTRIQPGAKGDTGAMLDSAVMAALALMIAGSIISGNRSPILGAGIFFVIYASKRGGSPLPIILGGLAMLGYFLAPIIIESMQSANLRIAQQGDRSAASRLPLAMLGWKLFLANPLGYGFGFDPAAHWSRFWHEIYTLQSADVIRDKALHNYPLSMVNTYGVGLLLAAAPAIALLYRARASLIYFIPYIIHIMFHNSGPFWNDTVIWFVIGAASAIGVSQTANGGTPHYDQRIYRSQLAGRRRPERRLNVRDGRKLN